MVGYVSLVSALDRMPMLSSLVQRESDSLVHESGASQSIFNGALDTCLLRHRSRRRSLGSRGRSLGGRARARFRLLGSDAPEAGNQSGRGDAGVEHERRGRLSVVAAEDVKRSAVAKARNTIILEDGAASCIAPDAVRVTVDNISLAGLSWGAVERTPLFDQG